MLHIYGDFVLIDIPAGYKVQLCMLRYNEAAPRPNRNRCLHCQSFLAAKRMHRTARRLCSKSEQCVLLLPDMHMHQVDFRGAAEELSQYASAAA